jgi:hypothetical protein
VAEVARRNKLKITYGISEEIYDEMLAAQGGACAICDATKDKNQPHFGVDHDHDTGKVRGILCSQCNRALGLFKDSPELLRGALRYMDETSK